MTLVSLEFRFRRPVRGFFVLTGGKLVALQCCTSSVLVLLFLPCQAPAHPDHKCYARNSFLIFFPNPKLKAHIQSFSPQIYPLWHSLPKSVGSSSSHTGFQVCHPVLPQFLTYFLYPPRPFSHISYNFTLCCGSPICCANCCPFDPILSLDPLSAVVLVFHESQCLYNTP